MTRRLLILATTTALALAGASTAFADDPHSAGSTGQPSQSCQKTTVTPGNATGASGSPFNPNGTSGTHYAGNAPQNSKNPNSVSQYDVACFQQTSH
ncbi:MAG TPA: adenylate cyclase [Candidatus Dormibacteraeota bacterium]|nr:adenylate cyclase [Candidatus Dormibacteraeota bacterium]